MLCETYANTLNTGDLFRDWLVESVNDATGNRIRNKYCKVNVYNIGPASHKVCRFEFDGEEYSVVSKFYAEPTGWKTNYDPVKSLKREFKTLQMLDKIISIPKPIAANEDFNCALVTEFVQGEPLYVFMRSEHGLYDRLISVADLLRKLHDRTRSNEYAKNEEFAHFHKILDQLHLDGPSRLMYDELLGNWWHNSVLDEKTGCRIHSDANPVNYVFDNSKIYALDFESSWEHANRVHDLGVVTAELKHYFALHKGDASRAEPYIGHFLWHYCRGDLEEFRRITRALPFFMAMGLLRIARLHIDNDHGMYINQEAVACLRSLRV
jgi:hypothetical protein